MFLYTYKLFMDFKTQYSKYLYSLYCSDDDKDDDVDYDEDDDEIDREDEEEDDETMIIKWTGHISMNK